MSKQIGKLLTCDRCGAAEFLPYIGEEEFDGGFARLNVFQDPSEPWALGEDIGDCTAGHEYLDLCPECRKVYLKIKRDFLLKGVQKQ